MIEINDVIRDNDPRMPNRRLVVVGFEPEPGDPWKVRVVCEDRGYRPPRTFRIRSSRIFTDDRLRRYGFNRVTR